MLLKQGSLWDLLKLPVEAKMPLRNITWKSPQSGAYISIDSLPARFEKSESPVF
ncbi:unnamed protein product, partial [Heterosigma akashiwo]